MRRLDREGSASTVVEAGRARHNAVPMAEPGPRPDTTRLQRLVHSYRDPATLMAAIELGRFTQVARGADTEAAIARALDLTTTHLVEGEPTCAGARAGAAHELVPGVLARVTGRRP